MTLNKISVSNECQCNRRYPCNHCTKRRKPEDCAYHQPSSYTNDPADLGSSNGKNTLDKEATGNSPILHNSVAGYPLGTKNNDASTSSVAQTFGNMEDGFGYTLRLLRNLGFDEFTTRQSADTHSHGRELSNPSDLEQMQQILRNIPSRSILDFLVQYFVSEVDWMDQIIFPRVFLSQYHRWWDLAHPIVNVADFEFAVLLLRVCSYATRFLPSQTHPVDQIRGMSLSDIRDTCDDLATNIAKICSYLDSSGSLIRIQHIMYLGLAATCESKFSTSWESIGIATMVAQKAGIIKRVTSSVEQNGTKGDVENEMDRRMLCNLYTWDTFLARRMGTIPFIANDLHVEHMAPRMNIAPSSAVGNFENAPQPFSERFLEAKIADFWRQNGQQSSCFENAETFDNIAAQQSYERFQSELLENLPTSFALRQPDRQWDQHLTKLSLQRQILHIRIFESICEHFSPVIRQNESSRSDLPQYKKILMETQCKIVAVAALHQLKAAIKLHDLIGGVHTRYSKIVLPLFDASAIILYLLIEKDFLRQASMSNDHQKSPSFTQRIDFLDFGPNYLLRKEYMQTVEEAVGRLDKLAEVSEAADSGSKTLRPFLQRVQALKIHFDSAAAHLLTLGTTADVSGVESSNMDLFQGLFPANMESYNPDGAWWSDFQMNHMI